LLNDADIQQEKGLIALIDAVLISELQRFSKIKPGI